MGIMQMYGCMNCGNIFHTDSAKNRNHCPTCGHSLYNAKKLEWVEI